MHPEPRMKLSSIGAFIVSAITILGIYTGLLLFILNTRLSPIENTLGEIKMGMNAYTSIVNNHTVLAAVAKKEHEDFNMRLMSLENSYGRSMSSLHKRDRDPKDWPMGNGIR